MREGSLPAVNSTESSYQDDYAGVERFWAHVVHCLRTAPAEHDPTRHNSDAALNADRTTILPNSPLDFDFSISSPFHLPTTTSKSLSPLHPISNILDPLHPPFSSRPTEQCTTPEVKVGCRLFVANLSRSTTDDGLRKAFVNYYVSGAKVIFDRVPGRSRGFGFISFPTQTDAEIAM